jgi:multicomponent Na+:H+ antiporter subunit G
MLRFTSDLLMVIGAGWALLAALGVIRFDDVYNRMHAATKSTTLGLLLILPGAGFHIGGPEAAKLLLVGFLVFVTAPVGAHLVGRAVHRTPRDSYIRIDAVDELRETRSGTDPTGDGG